MTEVFLSCFQSFQCIAGACPDTCCAGWEVDLDDDTVRRYRPIPGPLGEEIRSAICQEDEYTFFRLKDGQCPFLNKEKLCRLILGLGEDVLSVTCREHPRFWEEYGARRETCLSISCPEAARLLLEEPLELCEKETDDPVTEDPELDSEFFHQLLIFRQALFALTRSRRSLADQLSLALDAAENGITLPMEGEIPPEFWNDVPAPPLSLALTAYLAAMGSMEFTRPQLKELLPRVIADSTPLSLSDPEMQEEAAFYSIFSIAMCFGAYGAVWWRKRCGFPSTAPPPSSPCPGTWTAPRRTGGFWTPPYFTAAKWSTPRKIWSSSMSNCAA